MAETPSLIIEMQLRPDYSAHLVLPLDLTPREDPSSAAKFAVCDPAISIGITE